MTTAVTRLAKRIPTSAALVAVTVLVVVLAYESRRAIEIDLGSASSSAPFVEDFHDAEGSFRWSRAASCVVFPDVGAGVSGRVELDISAYRPRNQALPIVVVEAAAGRERVPIGRGEHTVALDVTPRGWWSSNVRVCVRSETFTPGPDDERRLGVRVHRARWVPVGTRPTVPPLRQVALSVLLVLFTWGVASRLGLSAQRAVSVGVVTAVALALAYAITRPFAAVLTFPLAVSAGCIYGACRFFPVATDVAASYLASSARCWWRGATIVMRPPAVVVALAAVGAVTGAYVARPSLSFDLGSGREGHLSERFGALDARSGVRFRRALPGAALDLTDFGGGTPWRVTVTGSLPNGDRRSLPLVRARGVVAEAPLDESWTSARLDVDTSLGWRSGARLEFPVAGSFIDRVDVDRGRALPPVRVVVAVAASALAFALLVGACGLTPRAVWLAAGSMLALEVVAIYWAPVLAVPFTFAFVGIVGFTSVLAALTGGALAEMSARGAEIEAGPQVAATVCVGFIVWLGAMSAPLYSGLHFVYHSNIGEEIWNGNFLIFYLPHPDNILSREAQWGGLLVPYSCLYHTLIAPLSALPTFWFQQTHKIFQAGMLALTALAGALGAWKLAGGRSALWTAILFITLPATFQLLGLAHFVTVFGLCAPTLAFVFLMWRWGKLHEASSWWGTVALVTLAFLSYTAALLFTGFTIALALPLLARIDRRQAKHLLTASAAAVVASLLLYYMHWVLPFIRESIPLLLASGDGEPLPVVERIARIPRKLDYSFGSLVVPLAGLAGVALIARRSQDGARWILVAWASVLVCFSVADVFFNFILKHHYFTLVPAAIGTAALLDWAMAHRWARWAAWGGLTYAVALGVRAAVALAMGTIE